MQISAGLCWLVAALILGGIDMVAGTFYLLMIGLGCLAGAVVYWADLSLAWQCIGVRRGRVPYGVWL